MDDVHEEEFTELKRIALELGVLQRLDSLVAFLKRGQPISAEAAGFIGDLLQTPNQTGYLIKVEWPMRRKRREDKKLKRPKGVPEDPLLAGLNAAMWVHWALRMRDLSFEQWQKRIATLPRKRHGKKPGWHKREDLILRVARRYHVDDKTVRIWLSKLEVAKASSPHKLRKLPFELLGITAPNTPCTEHLDAAQEET